MAEIRCHSQRKGNLARRLIFKTCRNAGLFLFRKIQHINSKAKQNRGFPGCYGASPDPSESPIKFRVSLNGMGLLFRGSEPQKCTTILGDDKR